MVRVEVVETSSQVWKTCILTAVLHSQIVKYVGALLSFVAFGPKRFALNGVGYRD